MNEDTRPRVFAVTPSNGVVHQESVLSHLLRGKAAQVLPGVSLSSILDHGFNQAWALALDYAAAGAVDWFLMQHSDVQALTPRYLDVMLAEAQRVGAAVLSVVQAIKDDEGRTSTAASTADAWNPRQLTLRDLASLPETFSSADLVGHGGGLLLVNTGLMLVDVRRREFHAFEGHEAAFLFRTRTRIISGPDGQRRAQVRPEDWEFSRLCHNAGLPVYATRKVACLHHGDKGFSNQPPAADAPDPSDRWFDFADVYDEAVARTPDGGTLVEVGCWKGKSLSYLLTAARRAGKRLNIQGVDHWKGSPGQPDMVAEARAVDLRAECKRRCDAVGYPYCDFIDAPSVEAAARFPDRRLDFVFIDAAHDFESVVADIRAWLPKVRPGGVLAGHDHDRLTDPDVPQAVALTLPGVQVKGRCWWYDVPER